MSTYFHNVILIKQKHRALGVFLMKFFKRVFPQFTLTVDYGSQNNNVS